MADLLDRKPVHYPRNYADSLDDWMFGMMDAWKSVLEEGGIKLISSIAYSNQN
jgi:hypothetical protein